jgi:Tfp pilus assembly protein PilF
LLKAGKPEAAEAAFKASLQRVPQNAWALYGLAEAHKARGDNLAADAAMSSLGRGWIGDRKLLSLERL